MVNKMDVSLNDVVKALRCVTQPRQVCKIIEKRYGCKEGGCPFFQTSYCTSLADIGFTVLLEDAANIISGAYGSINND